MAIGDLGGSVTSLVITCLTPAEGDVDIKQGDAVRLCGPYTVTNAHDVCAPLFGQALTPSRDNGQAIPVKVGGIAKFRYRSRTGDWTGAKPDGIVSVMLSTDNGAVHICSRHQEYSKGTVLALDADAGTVDVLL